MNNIEFLEDIEKRLKLLIEWKVYLDNNDFIHELYYKEQLIYSYKINENDIETILPIELKFKINKFISYVVKLDKEIKFKLGSERDKYITELFIESVIDYNKIKFINSNMGRKY